MLFLHTEGMSPAAPSAVLEVADLGHRLNALEQSAPRGRKRVVWRHRKVVTLLEALKIPIHGEPGRKKYVLLDDIREKCPKLIDSLLFAEQLADAVAA